MSLEESARIVRLKIGDKGLHDAGLAGEVKRAMRVAIARAGADYSRFGVHLVALRQDVLTLEHLVGAVQDAPAISLLTGSRERLGIAVMDLSMICAIVEHLTTGNVRPNAPQPRRPTATDMALCAGFLDLFLPSLDREIAEVSQAPAIASFRFRSALTEAANVELSLENDLYQFYRIEVGFQGSERQGELLLAFQVPNALVGATSNRRRDWEAEWRDQVDHVPVGIEAIMHRSAIPLSRIAALQPGDLLDIPMEQISKVAVIGANGKQVARAKLGRQGKFRALRITEIGNEQKQIAETDDGFYMPDGNVHGPMPTGKAPATQPQEPEHQVNPASTA